MSERANGFPWGEARPTRMHRTFVSLFIALASAGLHFFRAIENRGRSDFTPLWDAARLMLAGQNPYDLVGPGNVVASQYALYYPATTFLVATPFTLIPSFHWASTVFVFVSALLLAYGVTRDGWHLLPIFPSIAFLTSATLGQWSILAMAAIYLPVLGFLAAAKPPSFLPVIVSSRSGRIYWASLFGVLVLGVSSLVLLPNWPSDWWHLVGTSKDFVPAVMRFAGPLIFVVLLRWRRPESWLVFVAGCVPQTWPPYNGLILMSVATTYREASFLSLVSSASWISSAWFADGLTAAQERSMMAAVLNLGGYLPAVLLILTRPNEGDGPHWLRWTVNKFRRSTPVV
jgi:hypothetical protein